MIEPRFPKLVKIESKPHKFCPGCGHPIVLKMLSAAIEELNVADKLIFMVDIGCSLLAWDFFDLPTTQTHHGRTVPTATGFKLADPDKIVIAYMGDGGAYAIGLQHTINACLRGTPIVTIVVNNTVYGMTGGQMAPTTTQNEITTTTPDGKKEHGFGTLKGPELLAGIAPEGSYIARSSIDKPLVLKGDLIKAIKAQIKGNYSFVEVLSSCPTNWKTDAKQTIVRTQDMEGTFPINEFKK